MAYASLSDLKGRAGPISQKWTATSHPSNEELNAMLEADAAELDAILSARGFVTPLDGIAADAARNINADLTLLKAIPATFPAGEGPNAASALIESIRERVSGLWASLLDGTHPLIIFLGEITTTHEHARTTSFWTNEPLYPTWGDWEAAQRQPLQAPEFAKGMKF